MRTVIQRVSHASVTVAGRVTGEIGQGLLVLLGIGHDDTSRDVAALVDKVAGLRIFPDDDGRMNRSVVDIGGGVLVVSQFTLLAEVRRGRRPSFTAAADPEIASGLVDEAAAAFAATGLTTATGEFGASMDVSLLNHGPVTIVLDIHDGAVR